MRAKYGLLSHKVLGREYKKGMQLGLEQGLEKGLEKGLEQGRREGMRMGQAAIIRVQIAARFGSIPDWFDFWLNTRSLDEIEDIGERVLQVQTIKDLLP